MKTAEQQSAEELVNDLKKLTDLSKAFKTGMNEFEARFGSQNQFFKKMSELSESFYKKTAIADPMKNYI